jgi:flavin reductase ActVB
MTLDLLAFRAALAQFPSGVCIVTTHDTDQRAHGFTASAFSSLSLDPPLVLVCLDQKAQSHDAFRAAEAFAVSILAADQASIASQFAIKSAEKFEGIAVLLGADTGLPVIEGAIVHLECRMYQTIPAGDHTILIGEVVGAKVFDGEPLVYHNRRYGQFMVPDGAKIA